MNENTRAFLPFNKYAEYQQLQPCKPPKDKDGAFAIRTQEVKISEEHDEYMRALNRYYEDESLRNKQLLGEELVDLQTACETMLAGLFPPNEREEIHVMVNLKNKLRGNLTSAMEKMLSAAEGWRDWMLGKG